MVVKLNVLVTNNDSDMHMISKNILNGVSNKPGNGVEIVPRESVGVHHPLVSIAEYLSWVSSSSSSLSIVLTWISNVKDKTSHSRGSEVEIKLQSVVLYVSDGIWESQSDYQCTLYITAGGTTLQIMTSTMLLQQDQEQCCSLSTSDQLLFLVAGHKMKRWQPLLCWCKEMPHTQQSQMEWPSSSLFIVS